MSAVTAENGRIVVIKFTHPTKDGICTKVMPIRKKGMPWWKNPLDTWDIKVDRRKRTFSLSPSIWCREHDVHGLFKEGEWRSLAYGLTDMPRDLAQLRIDRAIEQAEQYGGDYWGAILALASKSYYSV